MHCIVLDVLCEFVCSTSTRSCQGRNGSALYRAGGRGSDPSVATQRQSWSQKCHGAPIGAATTSNLSCTHQPCACQYMSVHRCPCCSGYSHWLDEMGLTAARGGHGAWKAVPWSRMGITVILLVTDGFQLTLYTCSGPNVHHDSMAHAHGFRHKHTSMFAVSVECFELAKRSEPRPQVESFGCMDEVFVREQIENNRFSEPELTHRLLISLSLLSALSVRLVRRIR